MYSHAAFYTPLLVSYSNDILQIPYYSTHYSNNSLPPSKQKLENRVSAFINVATNRHITLTAYFTLLSYAHHFPHHNIS